MATTSYNYGTRVLGVFGDNVFTTTSIYLQVPFTSVFPIGLLDV
jgi:hypothetical protein